MELEKKPVTASVEVKVEPEVPKVREREVPEVADESEGLVKDFEARAFKGMWPVTAGVGALHR